MSTPEGPQGPVISGLAGLHPIGRGGFSVVYRARQPAFDREVAVKVLTVDLRDARSRQEFEQECRVAGRLGSHPNIVTVFGSGFTADGAAYIVMDLFPAGSLTDRLQREGPLEPADVARIGVRIAGALETAHRSDVLHRDLKPQNILLSPYGEPALADFGVAAFASSVEQGSTPLALTPLHAPPEVLEGALPTVAADVYSLASTLYELLAGRSAYAGAAPGDNDVLGVLLRMRSGPLPPIRRGDVPVGLLDVIAAAMALDPAARPGSAAAFGQALQGVQRAQGWPVAELALPVLDPGSEPPPAPGLGEADAVTVGVPRLPAPGQQHPPTAPAVPPPTAAPPAPGPVVPPPLAAPPAGGAPDVQLGEVTVGVAPPARPGGTPPPVADEGEGGRHRTLLTVVAVIVGLLVTVAVVTLVLGNRTKGHAGASSTTLPSTALSTSTSATTPAPKAPTGVKVAATGGQPGSFTVTWSDTNGGKVPYLVAYTPAAGGQTVLAHQADGAGLYTATHAQVTGLDPSTAYCFKVGAVRPTGDAIANPTWSTPVCP